MPKRSGCQSKNQPLISTAISNNMSDLKTDLLNLRIEEHFRKFFSNVQGEMTLNQNIISTTSDKLGTKISNFNDRVNIQFEQFRLKLSSEMKESAKTVIKLTKLSTELANEVVIKNMTELKDGMDQMRQDFLSLSDQIRSLSTNIHVEPKKKTPEELRWEKLGIHTQSGNDRYKFKVSNKLPVNLVRTSFIQRVPVAFRANLQPGDYPVITRKNGTPMVIVGAVDIPVQLRLRDNVLVLKGERFFVVDNLENDAYVTQKVLEKFSKWVSDQETFKNHCLNQLS